jgi:hypothetical protein
LDRQRTDYGKYAGHQKLSRYILFWAKLYELGSNQNHYILLIQKKISPGSSLRARTLPNVAVLLNIAALTSLNSSLTK